MSREAGSHGAVLFHVMDQVAFLRSARPGHIDVFLKLSGQEDIIIGTPIAARRHADIQDVVGMMVNTLVMRNFPSGEKTVNAFLKEVKQRTLDAYENQQYPFEMLVDKISVNRDITRNPVFDVMLNLLNQAEYSDEIPETNEQPPYQHRKATARFDMVFGALDLGHSLYFSLEYSTNLFTPATIEKYIKYLKDIILALEGNTEQKLWDIQWISKLEKEEILELSSGFADPPGSDGLQTFELLFAEQAGKLPWQTALVYEDQHLSYGELNGRANQLAWLLREKGVYPGTLVGLLVERSIEMIAVLLAILKAGGAYLPIDPAYPQSRILTMLEDSQVPLLLTTRNLQQRFPVAWLKNIKPGYEENQNKNTVILLVDQLSEKITRYRATNPESINQDKDPLYVIYTSGSTGIPKGVLLEHRNLVNLLNYQYKYTHIDFSRVLQFTTISFDVSFQEIFSTLLAGGRLILVSKETINDIPRLFKVVEQEKLTTLFLPASFLKFVINEEELLKKLPIGLKHIITAGEQAIINDKFGQYLKENSVYFHNHYGPAEAHVVTALTLDPGGEIPGRPPIGRPLSNTTIYILDTGMHLVPIGVPGELVIGGIQVGRGYLNNPELTREKFDHDLWDYQDYHDKKNNQKLLQGCPEASRGGFLEKSPPGRRRQKIYLTGDLARWLPDRNLEFLGRIDQQVKVRGFRVELGEIERKLLNHSEIKECTVIARSDEIGGNYICAYLVSFKKLSILGLREYLSEDLPDYMIPSYFVFLDKIPLTPNRKIDRRSLPVPELEAEDNYTAPGNPMEEKLASIWSDVLGIKKEIIGIHQSFFQLGGNSLTAVILTAKVHKEFHVKFPLAELFKTPSISGLSSYIRELTKEKYAPIQPVEKKEYYALSSAQKRLYILKQMDLENTVYNMPTFIPLNGEPEVMRLEKNFKQLLQRHESLRTSFHMIADEPVQKVLDEVVFQIEYDDKKKVEGKVEEESATALISSFIRSFDLSRAPLLRVGLIHLQNPPIEGHSHGENANVGGNYILIVDMHHIITDGISQEVLLRDFMALCDGRGLLSIRIQYKDYAQWQNHRKEKERIKKQELYWLRLLGDQVPVLDLPTDFPRPTLQHFEGARYNFELSPEHTRVLKSMALTENSTLFMALVALFNIWLARLSGQEDIIIGSPIAGRRHADLQKIIGMFVNTLALRNYPSGMKSFKQFLKEVKKHTLAAMENQEYQFEDLVEKVEPTRDVSRNPLFDVMIVLQDFDMRPGPGNPPHEGENNRFAIQQQYGYESRIAKFDLTLVLVESSGKLIGGISYRTRLFKSQTIQRFTGYFKTILSQICENEERLLSEIEIISPEEKHQVLVDFNRSETVYPLAKTIYQLFEQQVERTPDHIALVGKEEGWKGRRVEGLIEVPFGQINAFGEIQLSYEELNEKAGQLAHLLRIKGAGPDTIVGIMVIRSVEMIVGLLGIIKAGGAYLPIDPDSPQDRIDYMLKDSMVKVLLTTEDLSKNIKFGREIIYISDAINRVPTSTTYPHLTHRTHRTHRTQLNLAYVIYTSGSTGRPKGVLVEHKGVFNTIYWRQQEYNLGPDDYVLQLFSFSFDGFVTSFFTPIVSGSRVVLLTEDDSKDIFRIRRIIVSRGVTHFICIPSLYKSLLDICSPGELPCLRVVTLAGEAVNALVVEESERLNPGVEVANEYGATENTVAATIYRNARPASIIPIGKPIANTKIYIVNRFGALQPPGIVGELCISGVGLARGYLNQPELTRDKFKKAVIGHSSLVIKNRSSTLSPNDQCPMTNDHSSQYPIAPSLHHPIYLTGDLAQWLPGGNIQFLGRIDHQVKIRGYRIETEEIRVQLLNHTKIKDAVVITRQQENENKYLCAYVILNPGIVQDQWSSVSAELEQHLSLSLPNYMIPSYFVKIDRIPLTPSGKLNRHALPQPEIVPLTQHIPPSSETEKKLVEIWSEVLAIKKELISVHANFFRLGGHSLKAAVVVSKIRSAFNIVVPLIELFKTPSLKSLANYIEMAKTGATGTGSPTDNLVLLKPGTDNPQNLFFVHDGTGEVEAYIELCKHLSHQFNCWGIRAHRLENLTPQNWTIENLSQQYVEGIKKIQLRGPYFIAGWSLGGTIAFEMAKQLEQVKERIGLLALVDSPPPQLPAENNTLPFTLESESEVVRSYTPNSEIENILKNVTRLEQLWLSVVEFLEANHYDIKRIKKAITRYGIQVLPNYHQLNTRESIYYLNIGRTLHQTRAGYIPSGKINSTCHLFKASESQFKQQSWNNYCQSPMKIHQIQGNHFSLFQLPQVVSFSRTFNEILEKNLPVALKKK